MITVSQADALIQESSRRYPPELCVLNSAAGRILRQDIIADRDSPAESCSAMDGIAICFSAWASGCREFRVSGTQKAGIPQLFLNDPQACMEVMTGALIPKGSDTVIPVESLMLKGGAAVVQPGIAVQSGQFVRNRGKNFHAGDVLLKQGTILNPFSIGVCASSGQTEVRVNALPRIAFVETGDEVVPYSGPVLAHQVRSQNAPSVEAVLVKHGFTRNIFTRVQDDEELLRAALENLLAGQDILLLSGGVSMGQYDFGPRVLAGLGVKTVFHHVSQRPGKPLWFGLTPEGKPVFGLPGNPVSTLVCLYRYVLPFLYYSAGLPQPLAEFVLLAEDYDNSLDLTVFRPVKFSSDERAPALKSLLSYSGSDDTLPFSVSSGFVEIPAQTQVRKGQDPLRYIRWALV